MSSIIKFQLPPIKGTDVFPETIKTPPVVHASVDFLVDNENPVAPEVFEDRARSVLAEHAGAINQFVQSQRQNYGNGIVDYTKTSRSYPAFDVSYMNIQGRQEIVTLNMRVDVRRHGVVEEEERDELCVAVFHDGNQVSYAPMSELDNPTGNASRRILNQSNWGSDIIKTSQMKFINAASSIYTGLNGLTSGAIFAGTSYSFTTSILNSEVYTESDTVIEWPVMSGNGLNSYVPAANIVLSQNGDIESVSPVASPGSTNTGVIGNNPPLQRAWYIDVHGQRYTGLTYDASASATASAGQGIVPWPDAEESRQSYLRIYLSYYNNPYVYLPATQEYMGYSVDNVFSAYSSETISSYYIYSLSDMMPWPNQIIDQSDGLDRVTDATNIYSAEYYQDTLIAYQRGGVIFSDYNYQWSSTGSLLPGSFDNRVVHMLPFPPAIDNSTWYAFTSSPYFQFGDTYRYELNTPYGKFLLPVLTDTPQVYRGWLHASNGMHILQAFLFNRQKYMYLDRAQITSLLGVPVESIQTVLFDIPRSKIEQFQ